MYFRGWGLSRKSETEEGGGFFMIWAPFRRLCLMSELSGVHAITQ